MALLAVFTQVMATRNATKQAVPSTSSTATDVFPSLGNRTTSTSRISPLKTWLGFPQAAAVADHAAVAADHPVVAEAADVLAAVVAAIPATSLYLKAVASLKLMLLDSTTLISGAKKPKLVAVISLTAVKTAPINRCFGSMPSRLTAARLTPKPTSVRASIQTTGSISGWNTK